VVLTADAPASAERLRPSDSGWGTVVLPGGGHPVGTEDRTQLLAFDGPERDPAAAISGTARLSVGAPEPLDMVDSASLTGILPPHAEAVPAWSRGSGTAPPSDAAATIPLLRKGSTAPPTEAGAIASASGKGATEPPIEGRTTTVFVASSIAGRSTAPPTDGAAIAPQAGSHAPAEPSIMPPAGSHAPADHSLSRTGRTAIMSTAGNPLASGQSPVVGFTPTGGSPIVPRPGGRPHGRPPGHGPTGAHPSLRSSDGNARLAWGFLLGVLLTVVILAAAGALALHLLG
jgi:hypothetical protein